MFHKSYLHSILKRGVDRKNCKIEDKQDLFIVGRVGQDVEGNHPE